MRGKHFLFIRMTGRALGARPVIRRRPAGQVQRPIALVRLTAT
ncbi:MAG: hypothetical protein ACRCY8_00475 [Dermatophilaceae bacterium]